MTWRAVSVTSVAAMRRLAAQWLPSLVLAAAGSHELSYNAASSLQWSAAMGLVAVLVLRRFAPEVVLALTLALAGVGWAHGDLLIAHLGVLVALHEVGSRRRRPVALAAAGIVEAGAILAAFRTAPAGSINDIAVLLTAAVLAATFLGIAQHTQRDYVLALEERAAQLERERHHLAEIAAAGERQQIAREMHDIVAHSVSVMVALSEGAAATAPSDADAAGQTMRQVAATGRQALGELRGVLSVLRSPEHADRAPQPDLSGLDALVADVSAAGLPTSLTRSGIDEVPAGAQAALFRIVQEALTNALKHGRGATFADVVIEVGHGRVIARIRNDGEADPARDEGRGLRGMAERAAAAGGVVVAGRDPSGGWTVTASLPIGGAG